MSFEAFRKKITDAYARLFQTPFDEAALLKIVEEECEVRQKALFKDFTNTLKVHELFSLRSELRDNAKTYQREGKEGDSPGNLDGGRLQPPSPSSRESSHVPLQANAVLDRRSGKNRR